MGQVMKMDPWTILVPSIEHKYLHTSALSRLQVFNRKVDYVIKIII